MSKPHSEEMYLLASICIDSKYERYTTYCIESKIVDCITRFLFLKILNFNSL